MKIKDFLKEHEGEYVKIGFGSAFVFCDRITPETEKILQGISTEYLIQYHASRVECENRIRNYQTKGREKYIEERLIQQNSEYNHLRIEARIFNRPFKYVKKPPEFFGNLYDKYIKDNQSQLKRAEKAIMKFVPFPEAEISEIYLATTEPAAIIISKENRSVSGRYWTIREYKESLCTKEKEEKGNT